MLENKPLRRVEILVVEDNNADIRLIQEYFKDENMLSHNLNLVKDGFEAIKYLKKQDKYNNAITPDVILLDLNLPKMNGREVLTEIRNHNDLKNLIVCVMTASEDEDNYSDIKFLPPTFSLMKPVDSDKFLELMKRAESYLTEDLRILIKN